MFLIVGLWNPWNEYNKTRHNIWFVFIDFLCEHFFWENKFSLDKKYNAEIFKWKIWNQECIFCKPMTFMNKSWEVISKITNFRKISNENILILHDDIDLDTARLQIKFWWSSAGHNWLKNTIEKLWTNEFRRVRLGIDRPKNQQDVADYVLSIFPKEELNQLFSQENKEKVINFVKEFINKQ